MTEPELPGDPDDLALARVLDGLGPQDDADPAALAAHERAAADVDAIARALGLIGDTLAAEPAAGVVVPLWRRPSRAMLAAAASVVLVAGLGTALVLHGGGGGSSSHSAASAPVSTAGGSRVQSMNGMRMMAPAAPGAAAAAPAPAAAAESSSGTATTSGKVAAKSAPGSAGAPAFADAVGCARGILLGKVVSITSTGGGQYQLVLSVQEWIAPGSGPTSVTYSVGSAYAANDSSSTKLTAGEQRVFIVPQDPTAQIRAYADSTSLRKRIAAAQRSAGQSCG
jgi:hypothetical protein